MKSGRSIRMAIANVLGSSLAYVASIVFITLGAASAAFAAEADKPFAAPQLSTPAATPSAGSLVQVTLSLLFVLGAVFAAAWLVRRLKTFTRFGSGPIEVVADISVGAKERVVLVQVGGKQLLLGVAPGRVTTLHVLDELVSVEQAKSMVVSQGDAASSGDAHGPQRPDFKAILKRSLGL